MQVVVSKREWQVSNINSAFAWCQTAAHAANSKRYASGRNYGIKSFKVARNVVLYEPQNKQAKDKYFLRIVFFAIHIFVILDTRPAIN